MGTVPLDSCMHACKCNGTCPGAASAPGLTIEMLLKPNPRCFSSSFTFFSVFPPRGNHTALARVTGAQYLFEAQTANGPRAAPGAPPAHAEVDAQLTGDGVLSADYLLDGEWHHFAFVKDAATGAQVSSSPPRATEGGNKDI